MTFPEWVCFRALEMDCPVSGVVEGGINYCILHAQVS